ncbi:carboxypeptidase [Arabidopsis thaliana]|jgi:hypothetical protein|uniref:Carboxypeptidase n=1 Tax=Arabidopsis thaliana TaxID=3702 RepID=Q58FT9_ARATH|nr:carboxypeptidase [Arabidopsis thaliana]AAX55196.1 hypothetical protein At5g38060 [Arabidopsis thaliana]AAZ52761.1 expressed protein [Arabidopsis thaliana]AED94262.1 carboxypeptidase [Arabidopsis thaliana]|eukprot:NP_198622.1 carboxypeptidase [Arabidopsis thaliana]
MSQALLNFQLSSSSFSIPKTLIHSHSLKTLKTPKLNSRQFFSQCTASSSDGPKTLRTCKNCKTQFDPLLNNPRACRFHTAHFGGETKRKFESVYTGGTMDTPNSGKVLQYWHCCGSEDPFDSGCTASPHTTYDD